MSLRVRRERMQDLERIERKYKELLHWIARNEGNVHHIVNHLCWYHNPFWAAAVHEAAEDEESSSSSDADAS